MNGYQECRSASFVRPANPHIGRHLENLNWPEERKIFLYGLFDGSRCRYIGQTANPERRLNKHKFGPAGKIFKHGPMILVALRFCDERNASRLEKQIVMAYKRKGQCDLNESNQFAGGPKAGIRSRKFGVKSPIPRRKRIRHQVMAKILRIDPKLSYPRRAKLAEWIVEEILHPFIGLE